MFLHVFFAQHAYLFCDELRNINVCPIKFHLFFFPFFFLFFFFFFFFKIPLFILFSVAHFLYLPYKIELFVKKYMYIFRN